MVEVDYVCFVELLENILEGVLEFIIHRERVNIRCPRG